MKKSFALFASLGLAATGFLSSCDMKSTTPVASDTSTDTTPTPPTWVSPVSFTPEAGTYVTAQSVVLKPVDTTANVYYTVDGSIPTTASTQYTKAIPVTATTRVKAIAVKDGKTSDLAVAAYNISVTTIKPATGTYTSAQSVTLSTTAVGADIYYTTDGSLPTLSSTPYTKAIPVTSTTTINAISVTDGISSSVATSVITIPLVFAPTAGTFTSVQNVTLSTGTAGDTIYYTTDGSAPTAASTLYTSAIPVSSTTTIKAISVKAGKTSTVYSGAYNITAVTFKPVQGVYASAQSVALSTITAGGDIYYTTDGTSPTTSSTKYSGAISVTMTDTVKAIVVKDGVSSPVYKALYTFIPWNSKISYDSVKDDAGKSYKTVQIGSQTWMAENLNYAGSGTTPIGTCYKGSKDSCAKYGRLYTWSQVMNGATSSSAKVKGICPTGWHVPSDIEWITLQRVVDPNGTSGGKALKTQATGTSGFGWKLVGTTEGAGTDSVGFHAIPSGDSIGVSNVAGGAAFWWSSTQGDVDHAWSRGIYYNNDNLFSYDYDKTFGFAVRCTKD